MSPARAGAGRNFFDEPRANVNQEGKGITHRRPGRGRPRSHRAGDRESRRQRASAHAVGRNHRPPRVSIRRRRRLVSHRHGPGHPTGAPAAPFPPAAGRVPPGCALFVTMATVVSTQVGQLRTEMRRHSDARPPRGRDWSHRTFARSPAAASEAIARGPLRASPPYPAYLSLTCPLPVPYLPLTLPLTPDRQ
jgi:hypothetical protein